MNHTELELIKYALQQHQKPYILIDTLKSMIQPLAWVAIIFGFAMLLGYVSSYESIYRPITEGPATNPLTAMVVIFLALSLVNIFSKKTPNQKLDNLFAYSVMIISILRIIEIKLNLNLTSFITPFNEKVIEDQLLGKANSMGLNTSIEFLIISISLTFHYIRFLHLSQFVAFIGFAIPLISLTGYLYNLDSFYGLMSPITALLGLILSVCTLAKTAEVGVLRVFLSPYHGGKVARLQAISAYSFVTLLGYLFVKDATVEIAEMLGVYVVLTSWFVVLMIGLSATYFEKVDFNHRETEAIISNTALTDSLTGLANRTKFFEFAYQEIERVNRNHNQFWLLILDIDYFKKINDTAGHDVGDKVLKAISLQLQKSVRHIDMVGRIGGEEFAIVLVDSTELGTKRVAEQIRQDIQNMNIDGWTDQYGPITVSIGYALNKGNCPFEHTMKLADEALYKAKNTGRNQSVEANFIDCADLNDKSFLKPV